MKYTYAYKTSDGVRHEDSIEASSREEVFETLRARGIKAIKVVAADGSKANGEPPPRVPRLASLVLIAAALLAAALVVLLNGRAVRSSPSPAPANSSPRHQIYGDPATMEGLERGDFAAALPRMGDRMLAVFAQPGRFMCAKGADPRRIGADAEAAFAAYARDELDPSLDVAVGDGGSREVRELRQIVNGMRAEMREYLANGNGTARSYWRRLNERTARELQIYERTRRELEGEKSDEVWEQKNDALRRLGLRTIPNPSE